MRRALNELVVLITCIGVRTSYYAGPEEYLVYLAIISFDKIQELETPLKIYKLTQGDTQVFRDNPSNIILNQAETAFLMYGSQGFWVGNLPCTKIEGEQNVKVN